MPMLETNIKKDVEPPISHTEIGGEETPLQLIIKRFMKHRLAVAGSILMLLIILMAIFAPVIAPKDPYQVYDEFSAPPSAEHWLGTDQVGRDLFTRLIYASRVSMAVGLGAVLIYTLIGTILGAVSGYFGGWVDIVLMRLTDVFMSFPGLMLILVVVSILGPSLFNIIWILGLLGWPAVARLVRGTVLSLKHVDYVKSGVVLGLSTPRILFQHILPNAIAPILVQATFGIAAAIIVEASLSFLGMGVQPPTASWGNMLTDAQSLTVLTDQPWLWVPPGVMIVIVVLAINFIGDGLRDALDPKTLK
ncbi:MULTISPECIES: oligopeptide ABC transporter permease [Neobacillus]|uniref:ABC transporter permease n=1 Tax=Neobacillus rhizophilus TaxID=2833579 RepID=A0A942YUY8_9BACI|nr:MULTISPECIES: oligopeptide ABC transporter permease [Neobacillus]MBS4210946.1 ABC transporter permease [Neobacillus rhizophilus]